MDGWVELMHVRDENLERYVLGRLSPSRFSTVRSHISKCRTCEDRLRKTVEGVGQAKERRREVRSRVDAPATRQKLDPGSPDRSDIRVLDVSKSGLRLGVPELIEPGTMVQIRLKNTVALGEVRYCCPVGDRFHVGVQFTNVSTTTDLGRPS